MEKVTPKKFNTPPAHHPARSIWEHAYRDNNRFQMKSIELDLAIENFENISFEELIATPRSQQLVHAATELETQTESAHSIVQRHRSDDLQSGSLIDVFRLGNSADFALVSALAPQLYQRDLGDRNFAEYRRRLADGTEGISVGSIDVMLQLYDRVEHGQKWASINRQSNRELIGIIQEYTVLALLNRRQTGMSIAAPSKIHEDLFEKTDLVMFCHDTVNGYRVPIQVKTKNRQIDKNPPNGLTIYGSDFNNQGLSISRGLVAELSQEKLDVPYDTALYDKLSTELRSQVRAYMIPENRITTSENDTSHSFGVSA